MMIGDIRGGIGGIEQRCFDPRMLEAAKDLDLDQVMDKKKYVSIGG